MLWNYCIKIYNFWVSDVLFSFVCKYSSATIGEKRQSMCRQRPCTKSCISCDITEVWNSAPTFILNIQGFFASSMTEPVLVNLWEFWRASFKSAKSNIQTECFVDEVRRFVYSGFNSLYGKIRTWNNWCSLFWKFYSKRVSAACRLCSSLLSYFKKYGRSMYDLQYSYFSFLVLRRRFRLRF